MQTRVIQIWNVTWYPNETFSKEGLFLILYCNTDLCTGLQTWYFDTIHSAVTKLDNVTYGGLHLGCRYVFSSPSECVSGPITEVHVAFFIHHQLITCQTKKELINCQSNQGQSLQYLVSMSAISDILNNMINAKLISYYVPFKYVQYISSSHSDCQPDICLSILLAWLFIMFFYLPDAPKLDNRKCLYLRNSVQFHIRWRHISS